MSQTPADAAPTSRWALVAALVLVGSFGLRLALAVCTELTPDEAYYTLWADQLHLSYLDHPPMVALIIAATRSVLSGELGVRIGAVALSVLTCGLMGQAAFRASGSAKVGVVTLGLASATPALTMGGALMTPDAPLFAAWALASLAVCELERGGARRAWVWAGALALALWIGLLSKPTMALLLPTLVLVGWRAPKIPRVPMVAASVAGLCAAAPFYVLAAQRQEGLFFQLARFDRPDVGVHLGRPFEVLGGFVGLLTPMIGLAVVAFAVVGARSGRWAVAHCFTLAPLGVFALAALIMPVELNWILLAAVCGVPGAVVFVESWPRVGETARRGLFVASGALAAALTAALIWHTLIPIDGLTLKHDPTTRVRGWRGFTARVVAAHGAPGECVDVADRYQEASVMAFYGVDLSVTSLDVLPVYGPTPRRSALVELHADVYGVGRPWPECIIVVAQDALEPVEALVKGWRRERVVRVQGHHSRHKDLDVSLWRRRARGWESTP